MRSARSTGVISLRVSLVGLALVQAGCGAAQSGSSSPPLPTGVVVGTISRGGGADPIGGFPQKTAGVVTVTSTAGRVVAHGQARPAQGFRFVLAAGRYHLSVGGQVQNVRCPPVAVEVRAKQTIRIDLVAGCNIP